MGFLDLFRKKDATELEMRVRLVEMVMNRLADRSNRIRAEDAICAAAAIVGERCIDAAGDFPLRDHNLAPGTRVFSNRVNELLCGDNPETEVDALPPQSVYGILKTGLNTDVYTLERFPTLVSVFSGYAAGVGKDDIWGKVPVTVLPRNHPAIIPLQFAFETREKVDSILRPIVADKLRGLGVATKSLASLLNQMTKAIEPDVALRLAFEIVNGMAKTAPMTAKAFNDRQDQPSGPQV
jgi:hypothetical protein